MTIANIKEYPGKVSNLRSKKIISKNQGVKHKWVGGKDTECGYSPVQIIFLKFLTCHKIDHVCEQTQYILTLLYTTYFILKPVDGWKLLSDIFALLLCDE